MSTAEQYEAAQALPEGLIAVPLNDDTGAVHVVLPRDRLLDLDKLCTVTRRQLRAAGTPGARVAGQPVLVDQTLGRSVDLPADFRSEHVSHCDISSEVGQPANDEQDAMVRAIEKFTLKRVVKRLEDTLDIPPLEKTAKKIIQVTADPNHDLSDITDIVSTDASLAAQVVSWANSPFYGAGGTIESIEDAIMRVLGFDLVINLALGLALGRTLQLPDDRPHGSTPYWEQAVYTAATAEGLARVTRADSRPRPGLAYLSGLLHNFGFLVMAHVFPPQFQRNLRYIECNPHLSPVEVERSLMGIDRNMMAAWLLESWDMPGEVVSAIRHQDNPDKAPSNGEYVVNVGLARRMLRMRGVGDGGNQPVTPEELERAGVDAARAEEFVESVAGNADALIELSQVFAAG